MSLTRFYRDSRFSNNKGVIECNEDGDEYLYNSNDIFGTIVCEGAHPYREDHALNFLDNLVARGITHHIAAGDPNDGRDIGSIYSKGFLDVTDSRDIERLFGEDYHKDFEIKARRIENNEFKNSTAIAYVISVHTKDEPPIQINYLAFKQWKDFEAEQFNDDTIKTLQTFLLSLNDYEKAQLGVNCTAGLGRSGVIACAWALTRNKQFDKYVSHAEDNSTLDLEKDVAHFLYAFLERMRQTRPGLVQTDQQLHLAVALALQLRRLNNNLPLANTQSLIADVEKTLALGSKVTPKPKFSDSDLFSEGNEPIPHDLAQNQAECEVRVSEAVRAPAQVHDLEKHEPSQVQRQDNPIPNLVALIRDDNFWRDKVHFSFRKVPKGVMEMRKAIDRLESEFGKGSVPPAKIINALAEIADERLAHKSPFYLLFSVNMKNRDAATTSLYKLCKLLQYPSASNDNAQDIFNTLMAQKSYSSRSDISKR